MAPATDGANLPGNGTCARGYAWIITGRWIVRAAVYHRWKETDGKPVQQPNKETGMFGPSDEGPTQ
jgi:hypothetical protein